MSTSRPYGSESGALFDAISSVDRGGVERLFTQYSRGRPFCFARLFRSQDVQQLITETLTLVGEAVRSGSIREPERLAGVVMTVARRVGYRRIEDRMHSRRAEGSIDPKPAVFDGLQTAEQSPEYSIFKGQQQVVMQRLLSAMSR